MDGQHPAARSPARRIPVFRLGASLPAEQRRRGDSGSPVRSSFPGTGKVYYGLPPPSSGGREGPFRAFPPGLRLRKQTGPACVEAPHRLVLGHPLPKMFSGGDSPKSGCSPFGGSFAPASAPERRPNHRGAFRMREYPAAGAADFFDAAGAPVTGQSCAGTPPVSGGGFRASLRRRRWRFPGIPGPVPQGPLQRGWQGR